MDFIGDEPVTADEMARRVGAHARSLYRLLRALSTVGTETAKAFGLTIPQSVLLRADRRGMRCRVRRGE